MAIDEKELKKTIDNVSRDEIPAIMYEFYDTLNKIKKIKNVLEVHCSKKISDIFVVTEEDDIDLSEKILNKFAQWEATYHIFPELHIINKSEKFYIPTGSFSF